MMQYRFKTMPEVWWFVLTAVLTTVMQALMEFNPTAITDWRAWAVSLFAASVRAAAGATLAYLAKEKVQGD